jgi:hypothetical protein
MLQRLFLLILALTFFNSCKENKKSNATVYDESTVNSSHQKEVNHTNSKTTEVYCNITFGSLTTSTEEYQFMSSNAMRKGTIITLLDMYLSEEVVDKINLDIGFIMNQNTTNPKLKVGSYEIRPLFTKEESTKVTHFVMNTVIDEQMYQNAVDEGFLEDIENDYVLLSENANIMHIKCVKDIAGAPENSTYYEHGKQQIQGNASVYLLKVATKEKLKLTIDFKLNHDWTLSK